MDGGILNEISGRLAGECRAKPEMRRGGENPLLIALAASLNFDKLNVLHRGVQLVPDGIWHVEDARRRVRERGIL